ncbi:MAG: IS1380 family transposase [Acidobacteria bacterium]|nr:IS1380 family transposase [Acidobacteriota bacterium]
MKYSKAEVHCKTHGLPTLRFEDSRLTSFSGLILIQALVAHLGLKERLRRCFTHLTVSPIFGHATLVLCLVLHLMLGYRRLRDMRYYSEDPLLMRTLGLRRLPDVATLSRGLARADAESVKRLQGLMREGVVTRLVTLGLSRVTLDFDGSVIGTGKCAEGTAVGFNRKKKGQRSYYPLFCTVAQTGQVLDVLHRPGNVHDSHGAKDFILASIAVVRAALPEVSIEVRMDSAFFSDEIVGSLDIAGVEYTVSVPFERFTDLKARIEARRFWWRGAAQWSHFEAKWKPKAWKTPHRFLFIRTRVKQQHKDPIQLDLFVPHAYGYEFKVILTNKRLGARKTLVFHNGRGGQEGIFAELKSDNALGYVPTRTWVGNQIYLLSVLLAHNLGRELQMIAHPPSRATLEKRPAFWAFERLDTFRRRVIQRAGRLIRPQGQLTLSMSANPAVQEELLHCLEALQAA